jgi:putative heme iron utilization protein
MLLSQSIFPFNFIHYYYYFLVKMPSFSKKRRGYFEGFNKKKKRKEKENIRMDNILEIAILQKLKIKGMTAKSLRTSPNS